MSRVNMSSEYVGHRSLVALAVSLVIAGISQSAAAQEAAVTTADKPLEAVVVTGIRAALQSAAKVKRDADQVMDVITSEDVGKLPDANVAEALQRVTGVQITRVWGEGQGVAIRGLPLVRVEVDGRTVLGYSTRLSPPENDQLGRNSGLDVIPSALASRLEVSKSPLASQIEGGLSGTVNLITPDPLDFKQWTGVFQVQDEYSVAAKTSGPGLTFFVADQSEDKTKGWLFALDSQRRVSLLQDFDRNDFLNRNGTGTSSLPNSTSSTLDANLDGVTDVSGNLLRYEQVMVDRSRLGITSEFQVKLTPELELKAEAIYAQLNTERRQSWFGFDYSTSAITNAVFQGNSIVAGTVARPKSITQQGQIRSEPGTSTIFALSSKWKPEETLLVKSEVSASRGTQNQMNEHMSLSPTLATSGGLLGGTFDFRTGVVPNFAFTNFNPGLISNYSPTTGGSLTSNNLVSEMAEQAAKVDVRFDVDLGEVRTIYAGARYRRLGAKANSYESSAKGVNLTPFLTNTGDGFMGDVAGNFPRDLVMLSPNAEWIRSAVAQYCTAATTTAASTCPQPNKSRDYDFKEDSTAAYVMADFEGGVMGTPYRANAGARVVSTNMGVDSFFAIKGAGTNSPGVLTPKHDDRQYTNVLPSANVVFTVQPDFLVRASASKTMQQGGIADLAPTVFVSSSSSTTATATGGNADLKPTLSNNMDLSFELYGKGSSVVSGALFYKDVTSVMSSVTVQQMFDGFTTPLPYTRPENVGSAKVKGFEFGVQRFFDFLPAPFNSFGVIANVTYTDGLLDNGYQYPGLSMHSGNLIGLYENGPVTARLAYNTRDQAVYQFMEGRPNYIGGRAQLDFQAGYQLNNRFSIQFSAQNLMPKDSATIEFGAGGPTNLSSYYLSETRYSIALSAKL